ncbi:MAG TPA: hypothetical protein VH370_16345 [Humisphaera sp.]|jgi:hypothetical protein|nr:hypothetical protein [Humisphaera sp.]
MAFMRRLIRPLFQLLTMLAPLICLAAALLWVRSYYASDVWGYGSNSRDWNFSAVRGSLLFTQYRNSSGNVFQTGWPYTYYRAFGPQSAPLKTCDWKWAGAGGFIHRGSPYSSDQLLIPFWMIVAVSGVGSIPFFLRTRRVMEVRRRRRLRRDLRCPKCGYDLRATPMQCPECGSK